MRPGDREPSARTEGRGPSGRSRTRLRQPPWWLTASWSAVALAALAWFAPAKLGFAFLCPLRTITGIPCPTCGATHAATQLLQLHVSDALRANPLVALLGLGVTAICLLGTPLWLAGRLPRVRVESRGLRLLRVTAIVAILANWLYLLRTLL